MTGSLQLRAIGVDCRLVVTRPQVMHVAGRLMEQRLADLDAAASRFRPDSEVSALAALPATHPGTPVTVPASALLRSLVDDALWAADVTDGLVDPTLGRAMELLGYDADLADVLARPTGDGASTGRPARTKPSARFRSTLGELSVNDRAGTITAAAGTLIDLGATGKASMADRIAHELDSELPGGFLVGLGGDIAVAGAAPTGGWAIAVDDADRTVPHRISLTTQGVATSGTNRRRWSVGDQPRHHLLDPTTCRPVRHTWQQVTCIAASALEANTATTAACALGDAAVGWLSERRIPARLVSERGVVFCTSWWPLPDRLVGWAS
ncbi:FAD:protein FMN transferase [Leekyejoonella antrihumi]|uniref:FAD:protein FMN transferase n=1 Tax=Leekyejoonella antrihumi TaxID=1660198 RepID=A0A563DUA4_9MICO|nr:FAD:protein FMN transferase [Leekyejoonella antrihumi]TWP33840.1 FAD:protein FMN transferase [Leekyejoonella antrihumi]